MNGVEPGGIKLRYRMGSVAPRIPKCAKLPAVLAGPEHRENDHGLTMKILEHYGLSIVEAQGLLWQLTQYVEVWPKFEALPRNRNLPKVAGQNLTYEQFEIEDSPDIFVFKFLTRIWFSAPDGEIVRDFAKLLPKLRAAMKIPRWGHEGREMPKFTRDLVVTLLSEDKEWSADHIESQLKHMGLEPISPRKGDLKIAKRKILWDVRRILREVKDRRSLLNP